MVAPRVFISYSHDSPEHKDRILALSDRLRQDGVDCSIVAATLNNLAVLYDDEGKYTEAEPLYQLSLAIRENALGPDHPDTKSVRSNLESLRARIQPG